MELGWMAAPKKRRRLVGGRIARRWFAAGALVLVGLLYYRPLHDYFQSRSQRAVAAAEVRQLQNEQAILERRVHQASSLAAKVAEARTLGYVRPGEHLYIVKDIPHWRHRQHARNRHASSSGQ